MVLDVKTIQHDSYLELIVGGIYDLQDALEKFTHLMDACKTKGIHRVMIDCREIKGEPHATERILYAFGVEKDYMEILKSAGQEIKIAYIDRDRDNSYQPDIEHGKQYNLPIKVFTDPKSAHKWLHA